MGTKKLLDANILSVINATGGVLSITRYESEIERKTRECRVSMDIKTIFGYTAIEI
jgi:hypothetical protein